MWDREGGRGKVHNVVGGWPEREKMGKETVGKKKGRSGAFIEVVEKGKRDNTAVDGR